MQNILIVGAGGHGEVVIDSILSKREYEDIAFLDDNDSIKEILKYKVIGKVKDLEKYKEKYRSCFVALGDNKVRLKYIKEAEILGYNIPNIIHANSYISKFAKLGIGNLICANANVGVNTLISNGVIINTNVSVDHDCNIEEGVHISPGSTICGTVNIEKMSWICAGGIITNNVTIGSNVIVAAGSVVLNNIESNQLVMGIPAKLKRRI